VYRFRPVSGVRTSLRNIVRAVRCEGFVEGRAEERDDTERATGIEYRRGRITQRVTTRDGQHATFETKTRRFYDEGARERLECAGSSTRGTAGKKRVGFSGKSRRRTLFVVRRM